MSLNQVRLGCQARLCDSMKRGLASHACTVDADTKKQLDERKAQIAARIDRCLSKLSGDDKTVNVEVGTALGVSGEAVRQWRKGSVMPKLENLFAFVVYLRTKGIESTPEYFLLGLTRGLPSMELRERIADEGEELELLRLFRGMNRDGQKNLLMNARALQLSFPRGSNVQMFSQSKKKKRD
jgi:transcriptional regulator with XRE-family HTH domain